MSKIDIAGRVQHMPGPWGAAVPARGAKVEVIDVDPGGKDDLIWSGSTGADGRFAGTSAEWQDRKSVQVWVQDSWVPPRGHWESRSQPDPLDLLLLKLRVTANGRSHEVFPFVNAAAVPVVLPWGAPHVPKAARALLVLNNTVEIGRNDLRALYQFLEASGDAVARTVCGPHYQVIRSLNGGAATLAGFIAALKALAATPGIQAVDTILNMHGSDGKLWFSGAADGVTMSTLGAQLGDAQLAGKLRLLYSTCCYGHSHAGTLVKHGFNTAVGARKVVANSATEYPALLAGWVAGLGIADALAPAQAAPLRVPMDTIAREQLGFADADSFKLVSGDAALTIAAPAG